MSHEFLRFILYEKKKNKDEPIVTEIHFTCKERNKMNSVLLRYISYVKTETIWTVCYSKYIALVQRETRWTVCYADTFQMYRRNKMYRLLLC